MYWDRFLCAGSWEYLTPLCLYFLNCFLHHMSCIDGFLHWTSHTHLQSSALSVGSFLFFPFSTRAFPLPRRPRPSFRLVIPVNLMLKRLLQQSITAKTTRALRCLQGKCSSCRPRGASAGECTLCVTQQCKQRQRKRQTDTLSSDWQERALLLTR